MEIKYQQLCRMMDKLGYAESTPGTQYIRDAVEIAAGMERAMRTATGKATRSPSWDFNWKELGGWNEPTNSEVIMRLLRECRYAD